MLKFPVTSSLARKSMDPRNHQLFKNFPVQTKVNTSIGSVPTPYLIYDGYGVFIGGTADFSAVRQLLQGQDVFPLQTTDGKALMGIWICNFTNASLGSHHELQFSFFVSGQEPAPLAAHPLNSLLVTLTRPDIQMMCFGLWNNTPNVVAYNREILGLNARQSESVIEQNENEIRFDIKDDSTGKAILSGLIRDPMRSSLRATLSFMSRMGFQNSLSFARQPWISMQVINPKGIVLNQNAAARTFTKNDTNVIRYFEPADPLVMGDPTFQALNFVPQVLQSMRGIKFVYLEPGK
jgi:hypothetical protein